jgi:hypothetical protein
MPTSVADNRGYDLAHASMNFTGPPDGDIGVFHGELTLFVDEWMGHVRPRDADAALDILEGELDEGLKYWEGGDDIGVAEVKDHTRQSLETWLGLEPDAVPSSFKHTTPRLRLQDHQLQAMVLLRRRMEADPPLARFTEPTPPPAAPKAVKQGWGAFPATLIADEMGLGKTVTALATVGNVIDSVEHPHAICTSTLSSEPFRQLMGGS